MLASQPCFSMNCRSTSAAGSAFNALRHVRLGGGRRSCATSASTTGSCRSPSSRAEHPSMRSRTGITKGLSCSGSGRIITRDVTRRQHESLHGSPACRPGNLHRCHRGKPQLATLYPQRLVNDIESLPVSCHGSFIQPRPEPGLCLRRSARGEQSSNRPLRRAE